MTTYRGISVVTGIAFGCVHILNSLTDTPKHTVVGSPDEEWERFQSAKIKADTELEVLIEKTEKKLGEEHAMIIDVQRLMLEDDDFIDAIKDEIYEKEQSAPHAVSNAGKQFSDFFASLEDTYMQTRATDVLDVARRLENVLLGHDRSFELIEMSVIVADDLTPSETLEFDRDKIAAFVIRKGSASSHTAILAQTMNIPCLIQTDIELGAGLDGRNIIVDGENGVCYVDPNAETSKAFKERHDELKAQQAQLDAVKGLSSVTLSGKKILVCANIGSQQDVKAVLENDADGIGLFRSEFLYLGRDTFPNEDELFAAYREVAERMNGKAVIIRTLDIGADKKVEYFGVDEEENPALGLRGIRICIDRPEIFRTQLRAIYRASAFGNVAIMFPMISSKWEVEFCVAECDKVMAELAGEGCKIKGVELGIMIETPAAAMISDELAKLVDFFSVGTNDLTQYTLAIDRQNSKLGQFYVPHHPAVLELLHLIAKNAVNNGIWAGICGELAGDITLTEKFVEMGYTELSVVPYKVLTVRKKVRDIG